MSRPSSRWSPSTLQPSKLSKLNPTSTLKKTLLEVRSAMWSTLLRSAYLATRKIGWSATCRMSQGEAEEGAVHVPVDQHPYEEYSEETAAAKAETSYSHATKKKRAEAPKESKEQPKETKETKDSKDTPESREKADQSMEKQKR
eukprot:CAMPEP_0170499810 /NCGR_PEP_ID=MMETSP0208-20121228/32678_1 /TAXON_ID=197538 /ORGANISM="Strombidium inclinatum, Strain S3" /LENGTH=143 /DNA_ID=CAMNT_0010777543 /DNA_START=560 /DNA_END=990 /DNA_ORIENTATION=+